MDLHLSKLTAVVTGGSSGIGAAIVRILAAEGCTVEFCARTETKVDALVDAMAGQPGMVRGRALDVRNLPRFQEWLDAIGQVDIFVANVSALSNDWEAAIETDIKATIDATEAVVPHLAGSRHAAITYIGSKAASLASPGPDAYGSSKAAVAHYMKSLALRLLPAVRVNTVSPGDTLADGGIWDRVRVEDSERFATVVACNPMKRLATAEEVARVVAFISSPAAGFVAGANWYVDGGSVSHVQF